MDLKTIAFNVLNCNQCSFRDTLNAVSSPTPGFGNPNAKIMVVNLRTTLDAHIVDKPIGTRNEILLKKILQESGLSPKDVYFTNVIKCAGPITPKKAFKASCATCVATHLKNEIDALNPDVIICLGTSAYDEVLKIRINDIYKTYSLEEIYRHGKQYISSTIELFAAFANSGTNT